MKHALRSHGCWMGIALCVVAIGVAADDAKQSDKEEEVLERWMALYLETAQAFDMQRSDDGHTAFTLHETPLLSYTNPVRNFQQHGAVYLWTEEGRPAVIASFWSTINRQQPELRNLAHEWHSLSIHDIAAHRDGELQWQAMQPGVEWLAVDDAPAPASSRALRLVQMRRIVSSVSVEIATQESELRLLPQPIYRYPESTTEPTDGAIFAFVMGTDPELFALVESRTGDDGEPGWWLAFARFTHQPVIVRRRGREIWSCDKATPNQRTGRFYLHWRVEQLPAELEDDSPPARTSDEAIRAQEFREYARAAAAACEIRIEPTTSSRLPRPPEEERK